MRWACVLLITACAPAPTPCTLESYGVHRQDVLEQKAYLPPSGTTLTEGTPAPFLIQTQADLAALVVSFDGTRDGGVDGGIDPSFDFREHKIATFRLLQGNSVAVLALVDAGTVVIGTKTYPWCAGSPQQVEVHALLVPPEASSVTLKDCNSGRVCQGGPFP